MRDLLKNFLELLLSSLSDLIQTNQNRLTSSSLLSVFVFWFYLGEETLAKEKKAEYLIVETESRLQPRKLWTSSRRNKRLEIGFIWARKVFFYNNHQKLQRYQIWTFESGCIPCNEENCEKESPACLQVFYSPVHDFLFQKIFFIIFCLQVTTFPTPIVMWASHCEGIEFVKA